MNTRYGEETANPPPAQGGGTLDAQQVHGQCNALETRCQLLM